MANLGLTLAPHPSHPLGCRAEPGARGPAPMGAAGAVLPWTHNPRQQIRYARQPGRLGGGLGPGGRRQLSWTRPSSVGW